MEALYTYRRAILPYNRLLFSFFYKNTLYSDFYLCKDIGNDDSMNNQPKRKKKNFTCLFCNFLRVYSSPIVFPSVPQSALTVFRHPNVQTPWRKRYFLEWLKVLTNKNLPGENKVKRKLYVLISNSSFGLKINESIHRWRKLCCNNKK